MKPITRLVPLLLCAAIGNTAAQTIQWRKQSETIPLPVPAAPKPATHPAPATAVALTSTELFKKVSPSIVTIMVYDDNYNTFTGSGVVIPNRDKELTSVVTNCHVTDKSSTSGMVFADAKNAEGLAADHFGFVKARDPERDLCIVDIGFGDWDDKARKMNYRKLPAVQIGSSQGLNVGDKVYAIGAPQGLELTLSDGLVSGLRDYKGAQVIQTTAPISKGSSGGGLFDAQGRLVGITTMYLDGGQNLNFAMPAELIARVPAVKRSKVQPAVAEQESAPQPAPRRDRWVQVSRSDSYTAYVDAQTLQRNGTDVTVWEKFAYDKPKTDKYGDTYDEVLSLYTYHCATRQYTKKFFSQRLCGNPNPVYSKEYKSYEQEREIIMPGTFGESTLGVVCE
ncbi:MAG TPA: hypothetical protein DCM36_05220 [Xanthomonadaceae bacterium]|nr:hypothetical protein [Xanthomonadaceae bacterium]